VRQKNFQRGGTRSGFAEGLSSTIFFILLLGVIAIPYLLNAMYIWIAVARPGTRQEMTAPRLAPKNSKEN
jgi:hypothetical protein